MATPTSLTLPLRDDVFGDWPDAPVPPVRDRDGVWRQSGRCLDDDDMRHDHIG